MWSRCPVITIVKVPERSRLLVAYNPCKPDCASEASCYYEWTRMAQRDKNTDAKWVTMARLAGYDATALANKMQISRRQLERYTSALFMQSPQRWLNEQRMTDAATMLKKQLRIKNVAFSVGFKQLAHFSREFKNHHGLSPRAFLKLQAARSTDLNAGVINPS